MQNFNPQYFTATAIAKAGFLKALPLLHRPGNKYIFYSKIFTRYPG